MLPRRGQCFVTLIKHVAAHRLHLGRAKERVSVAAVQEDVADALGIVPDTPVIQLDRILLTLDGYQPTEWRIVHCHLAGAYYLASIA
jgi:DNA-binding GntR family transcriptional regulator